MRKIIESTMEIELSAGTIEYEDSGGGGPAVALLHGLMMDASPWDGPIADLSADHRCVAPMRLLGAHRRAMHTDADLSLPGITRLAAEFLDRLDLQDVTLVAMTPAGRSSSCSSARAPPAWEGSCAPHAMHSTTSRPGRQAAGLQPPRPRGLGQQRPRDAARARPTPRRTAPVPTAGRGRRQLHTHPAGTSQRDSLRSSGSSPTPPAHPSGQSRP